MKKPVITSLLVAAYCAASAQFSTETRNVLNANFNDFSVEFRGKESLSNPDSATANLNNGKYSVVNKSTKDYWAVAEAKFTHYKDYDISVETIHRSGTSTYGYGLYWGDNSGKPKYMYLIDANGYYCFYKQSSYSNDLTSVIKWKISSNIKTGDNVMNKLAVKMSNYYWHFYINDVMVDSASADSYYTGDDVGVIVANKQQVDFDNLTVTQVGYKKVSQSGTLCSLFPFFEKTGKVNNEPINADEKYPAYGNYANKTTVKVTDAADAYMSGSTLYVVLGKYSDASEASAKLETLVTKMKACLPNYYFRKKQKGFEPPYYYIHEKVAGGAFKDYKSYAFIEYKDNEYKVQFAANSYTSENILTPIANAADKTSDLGKQVWQAIEAGKNNFADVKGAAKDDNSSYSLTTYYKSKLEVEGTTEGEIYTLIFTSMDYYIAEKISKSLSESILNDWRDKLKKIMGSEFMMMTSESKTSKGELDSREYKFYNKDMDKYPVSVKMYKSYSGENQYTLKLQFNGNDW